MREYSIIDVKRYILDEFNKANIYNYECNYLLAEVFNCSINDLIFIKKVSKRQFKKIQHIVKLRIKNRPLTKIFKRAYFYGLKFYINDNVLSCRPETEILIDKVLENCSDKDIKVLDLCAGSGCIGITLKSLGYNDVTCLDISKKACKVIKKNCKKLNQNVQVIRSNLFEKIHDKYDVIVSNPPYIKSSEIDKLDNEVKYYDPIISLDGGSDGLYFYKQIISNADKYLTEQGKILFEIGYDEAKSVCEILNKYNYNSKVIKDYSNNDRVILATRR